MSRLEVVCEFSEKDAEKIKMFSKVNSKVPNNPVFVFFHGFRDMDTDNVLEVTQKLKGTKVKIAEIRVHNTINCVMARLECEALKNAFHYLSRKVMNSHSLHEGKYTILL